MGKKMLIFIGVIVILFGALYFVVDSKNKKAVNDNDNPYGKTNLEQETIDQLDDPLYQNQITPDDLDEKLDNQEDLTVYFYSPTCGYCQKTTPELVPLAEDLDVDVKKLNLLEFDDKWNTYGIEGTPTLVRYENGKEVGRISGQQNQQGLQAFFDEYVLDE
ncbi:MAG TPA: thioredoxin family protein [Lentibacillus sp.]|uniref:thioredoxin family protein n=1 Tax=Lentibacillus sp. TaxID=1925746 RepID=UPI002B4B89C8|nr:thioredoxin family protein [Lentibacillus sp.]HLR63458.1 thioredoxin family protein [Lentibacillus sp.]